jgi:sporulation protein YlmC with PRC-barrel domain
MKNVKQSSIVGAMAVVSVLSGLAFAQQDKNGPDKSGQTGTTQSGTSMSKDKSAMADKKGPCVCFASDVVGMKVQSTTGEDIGKIEDVVVNPGGEVAYAVLSFGGFMGMGDKLFAVPWNVLQTKDKDVAEKGAAADTSKGSGDTKNSGDMSNAGRKHQRIVLPIDKERLKSAPGFDKDHWPAMANLDWARDVDAFYRNDRSATSRPIDAANRTASPAILKYSDLKGFNVETPTGDKLGDIKELAIDMDGRISYAAISVGGFLGMGDRVVAVPWDALKVTREGDKADKKKITLATTKDRLEQAPVFKKDTQDQMCDPAWIGRVYEFYSVRPYWSTTG